MEIRCPKNAYISEVLIGDGESVIIGQELFKLTTTEESASLKKLHTLAAIVDDHGVLFSDEMVGIELKKLESDLSAAKAEEAHAQRFLDQAQARFDVGLIAITDVLEAKIGPLSARAKILNAEEALREFKKAVEIGKKQIELFRDQHSKEIGFAEKFLELSKIRASAAGIISHALRPMMPVSKGTVLGVIK
ncbi:TolC family protein [Zoogloeaceae bacterium G21618-S1]|nr:TolC family protein [Zoogloeaceae bacterium G21618-S1]